jgi:alpha-galactosidase
MAHFRRILACATACLAVGIAPSAAEAARITGTAQAVWVLSPTPYMGWNTYYGVGGVFNQGTIISVANSLLHRGLARAGYRVVWLDFGWASGQRASDGTLIVDRRQWPNGLPWLTGWLHEHGLLAGIYTDAGASGCYHQGVGSLGHYQQDADSFAAWGFDAVKVDFCGAGQDGLSPRPLYRRFARALEDNASHRPMLMNVCNFWVPGQIDGKRPSFPNSSYANALWAPRVAQSWRTDTDIGGHRSILFKNVLRNLDRDAAHPGVARPGHWNDPDYLGPQLGMTRAESQAQLTMWAMVAAPLMLGSDPRRLSGSTTRMLENKQVIAVDQDRLGAQGRPIARHGDAQAWVKPLVHGARAVALLNRGTTSLTVTTNIRALRLARVNRYKVENLWTGATHNTTGSISARVPPDSALLYRVTPNPTAVAAARSGGGAGGG